jgi:hypothetical protein
LPVAELFLHLAATILMCAAYKIPVALCILLNTASILQKAECIIPLTTCILPFTANKAPNSMSSILLQ